MESSEREAVSKLYESRIRLNVGGTRFETTTTTLTTQRSMFAAMFGGKFSMHVCAHYYAGTHS
jgi:hypothetical protein